MFHFKSDRLIQITCDNKVLQARKRGEEEKVLLIEQRTKDRETAQKQAEVEAQSRDQNKEVREKIKQEVFT